MSLRTIRVQFAEQIEYVRYIRNVTKDGFSYHNAEISKAEQIAWWDREKPLAWLYSDADGIVVGFGMLRQDEVGHWVTVVAVLPEHAGHNYGKAITHDLVMRAPGRVYGCARRDNPAAVRLHVPEEWDVIEGPDPRLAYFRTKPELRQWPPEMAREQWATEGWVLT